MGAGRQYNETGPQPIPHSEIIVYMNDVGIFGVDDRWEFIRYIRTLDGLYLKLSSERMQRERDRLMKSKR